MKEFGIRSKDTANTTTEGFSLIGLDADEMRDSFAAGGDSAQKATAKTLEALFSMDDQVKQNQAGVDLFGTMWEDLGIDGVKALMDVNGEADKTANTMSEIDSIKYNDAGNSLAELGRTIKVEIIQPIVNEVLPVIRKFIDEIKNIKQTFSELSPVIAGVGTALAGLAITALIGNFTKFVALVKSWTVVTKLQTAAQTALNLVMNMNPIGIVISLIAGLVAAFVVLWNKSEKFRDFWINLWEKVKSVTNTVVTAIKDFFVGLWENIKSIWSVVSEWFSTLFTNVKNSIITVFTPVKEFFIGIWEGIKTIFTPVIEWFSQLFSSVFQTISDIFNNLVVFFRGIWEIIKTIFTPVIDWFKEKFQAAWDGIKEIWSAVTEFFSDIWDGITEVFSTVNSWLAEKFQSAWDGIKKVFSKVGTFFSTVWSAIKKPFSAVATWFKDTFKKAWEGVKNVFSTGGKIFSGIKEGIENVFKTVVNGIIKSINKVISVPFDAINGAIGWIRDLSIAGFNPFSDLSEINVPQIPLLEQGGVLKKGQTGYLEGNGDEAVVPLQKNTGWLDEIANRLAKQLDKNNAGFSNVKSGNTTVVNNFHQTNNSPKSLSRLEIYRQSKNLLSAKGG